MLSSSYMLYKNLLPAPSYYAFKITLSTNSGVIVASYLYFLTISFDTTHLTSFSGPLSQKRKSRLRRIAA